MKLISYSKVFCNKETLKILFFEGKDGFLKYEDIDIDDKKLNELKMGNDYGLIISLFNKYKIIDIIDLQ